MNEPASTFLKLAGSTDHPLYIVTTADGDRREGCVVAFAMQTSFHPARFLACLSRENRTYELALRTTALAAHLIPRGRRDLVELFGGATGDELDKFERCAWHPGPRGLPIVDGCPSWFAGAVLERFDLGDHVGFLLDPVAAAWQPGPSICFHEVKDLDPGHPT